MRFFVLVYLLVLPIGCTGAVTPNAADVDGGDAPSATPGTKVFAQSRLHRLDITVAPEFLDRLNTDRENRVPASIQFDDIALSNVGVRLKTGFGSFSDLADKPGWSFKFNEFVGSQRLDGLRKLVVNNAKQDLSFLNDHLAEHAHRLIGLRGALTSYAMVTFNGRSLGLMILTESIDKDLLERWFGNNSGNLYEGFYHPNELPRGDFVLHPEDLELKDEVKEMRNRADVVALAMTIRDTADDELESRVSEKLALEDYLCQWALDSLLGSMDSYHYFVNNYYLYNNPTDGRFHMMPHGMDRLTFQYDSETVPMGVLPNRMKNIPALRSKFLARVDQIRQQLNAALLQNRITEVALILHGRNVPIDDRLAADIALFDANIGDLQAKVANMMLNPAP
jgi:spore coat protein H